MSHEEARRQAEQYQEQVLKMLFGFSNNPIPSPTTTTNTTVNTNEEETPDPRLN